MVLEVDNQGFLAGKGLHSGQKHAFAINKSLHKWGRYKNNQK